MRRFVLGLAGIFILLCGLSFAVRSNAVAMDASSGNTDNACTSGFPAPYTGGAGVAKFFHLSDGSTVTITTTGAVIKQGRCGTPYREGWINVSDICSISSSQDLNGRLSSGSSNPNGSGNFTACNSNAQTLSPPQRPAGTSTSTQTQSQSQSQSVTVSAAPQVKSATTSQPAAQSTSAVKNLPNTGPGNVIALAGAATAIGTVGHWFYSRRSRYRN